MVTTTRLLCFLAIASMACGLEEGGIVEVRGSATDDAGTTDALVSTDGAQAKKDTSVQSDGASCGVNPSSCKDTTAIPNGWAPVVVAQSSTTCGAGFDGETHAKTNPIALSGACDCQAQNPSPPTCNDGTLTTAYGPFCVIPGATAAVANGACTSVNWQLALFYSSKPIAPSGGSCTGAKVLDTSKVSGSDVTVCAPTTCPEKVCAGVAPQGFAACIEQAGDVACPNGSPFSKKQTLGDTVSLTDCSACTCTASATCDKPNVDFFSDSSCKNSVVTLASDNSCQGTNNNGASVKGITYTANVTNPTYVASGPKTPTVELTNQKTICCR